MGSGNPERKSQFGGKIRPPLTMRKMHSLVGGRPASLGWTPDSACYAALRVLAKEAQHLDCRIPAMRVREGTGRAAAGPGVACSVDEPMLGDDPRHRIAVYAARVG